MAIRGLLRRSCSGGSRGYGSTGGSSGGSYGGPAQEEKKEEAYSHSTESVFHSLDCSFCYRNDHRWAWKALNYSKNPQEAQASKNPACLQSCFKPRRLRRHQRHRQRRRLRRRRHMTFRNAVGQHAAERLRLTTAVEVNGTRVDSYDAWKRLNSCRMYRTATKRASFTFPRQ
jgi:hypothetical protein